MTFANKIKSLMVGGAALLAAGTATAETRQVDMALAGGSMIAAIPLFVDYLGYFEQHGIEANFIKMDSASAAATAMMSGSVAFAFSGVGSLVAAQAQGQDVVAVNATYRGLGGTLVLDADVAAGLGVAADAPIGERLAALEGLNLASPSPTSSYTLAFKGASNAEGANPNFTYMSIPTMPAALATGAVDGYVASAPYWLPPVLDGSGVLWIAGPKGEIPQEFRPYNTAVTITTRDYAEANPEIVADLVAAFNDFNTAISERPEDVKAVIREVFPDLAPETLDPLFEAEAAAWTTEPLTPEMIAHEVNYVLGSNDQIPESVRDIDPATMIFP